MRSFNFARVMAVLVGLVAATSLGACSSSSTTKAWSASGTVSGAVSQGVTLTLGGASSATTTTDALGHYAFPGLPDGSYTLTPSLAGYTFNPTSRTVTVSGADVVGQDFTATALPHAIAGTVSGAVSQGVTVTLGGASSATTTTDTRGHYSFADLANGSFTVTPSLTGYSFTPANRSVTLSGADVVGQDFTAATSSWSFVATGHMTVGRSSHTATPLASGKVLVVGGEGSSAELYDPATGAFTATGNTVAARMNHSATLLPNGKVLVAGGALVVATAELYDPATGTFSATGSMTVPRMVHTATLLRSGKVLVAGGFDGSSISASAELYDPAAGTFTATGSLAMRRAQHTATLLLDGQVLVAGGYESLPPEASAELYDPATGTFTAAGNMIGARYDHTATLLLSGKVLVAAGRLDSLGNVPLASAELYDPVARTFSATGSLAQARSRPEATLLPGGRVLLTGGGSGYAPAPGPAELYDAGSGAFLPAGSMLTNRYGHTASLLAGGKALVTGGYDGSSVLSSAELYAPSGAAFFTQADLTGDWDVLMLSTNSSPGWSKVLARLDAAGHIAVLESLDDSGNTTLPPPGTVPTMAIASDGTVRLGGAGASPTFHGTMTRTKTLVFATDEEGQPAAVRRRFWVMRKRVPGVTYSSADIANFSFAIHGIYSGPGYGWMHGAGTTDAAGVLSLTQIHDSSGGSGSPGQVGTLAIDATGLVVNVGGELRGVMTSDKNAIFFVDTTGGTPQSPGFLVVLRTGRTFALGDLAGDHRFHAVTSGADTASSLWIRGTATIDASGLVEYTSFRNSAGSTTLLGPAQLALSPGGVLTMPSNATYHGQLSWERDFYVRTVGPATAPSLAIVAR